jgi:3-hydroxyacyl-CoA dehydrogenase
MGRGIAQVFALAGHTVTVHDSSPDALASLNARIRRNLAESRWARAGISTRTLFSGRRSGMTGNRTIME